MSKPGQNERGVSKSALRGDAKDGMNECNLPEQIVLCQPPDLSFAYHVHCLLTGDRVQRITDRSKPQARRDSPLNEAVVLFDDIVHIGR
jgi:hypothetical protein